MRTQDLALASGDAHLRGTLSLPDSDEPCPAVVVAHGASAGTRDYFLYRHLARLLGSCGVATFRYDRRGEGSSTGAPDAPFDRLAGDTPKSIHEGSRCGASAKADGWS
jgi:alpha-beta hydrolase superfamily lysophospholipase